MTSEHEQKRIFSGYQKYMNSGIKWQRNTVITERRTIVLFGFRYEEVQFKVHPGHLL